MHTYQLKGGQLLIEVARHVRVSIAFTFYVWDTKAKIAAYCTYFSNMSAEDVERQQKALLADRGEDDTQRIGLGQSAGMLQLEKPLDMKLFVQDMPPTGSLSIAKYKDTSSQMTAWVTLDEGHVMLPFPIVSSLSSSFPVNTRGRISATTEKTRHPKFPSDLMKDPAVGRG